MTGSAYLARVPSARATRRVSAGAGGALLLAAVCVLALAATWCIAQLVPAAQLRDAITLHDFTLLSRPHVDAVANFLLHLLDPVAFIFWGGALVCVALLRGRPRVALAVVVVMALAPLTSETLKPLLAHPHASVGDVHIGPASWPSGHSTAALALALCAVLVAPARARALVGLAGALFALGAGCALLILAWHMPSDVLGGYLVAILWTALALAALRFGERWRPSRNGI